MIVQTSMSMLSRQISIWQNTKKMLDIYEHSTSNEDVRMILSTPSQMREVSTLLPLPLVKGRLLCLLTNTIEMLDI